MIGKSGNNYVKYDPAYIYNSGLQTFGILRSPQLYELIYSTSKALHNAPKVTKTDNEDTNDDADEMSGLFQFCSFPNVDYDFTQKCTLDLTVEDKDFIVDHILNAEACQGTLLRYIVDNPDFAIADSLNRFPSVICHMRLESCKTWPDVSLISYIWYTSAITIYIRNTRMKKCESNFRKT